MDIISIAPAPAPEQSVQTTGASGARGDSGFNGALNQALSAKDNTGSSHQHSSSSQQHTKSSQQQTGSSQKHISSTQQQLSSPNQSEQISAADNGSEVSVFAHNLPLELDQSIDQAGHFFGATQKNREHNGILFSSIMIKASLELPQGPQTGGNTPPQSASHFSDSAPPSVFASFSDGKPFGPENAPNSSGFDKSFQSPYLSITIKGESTVQTIQLTPGEGLSGKNSLMLAELQKLISQNNDTVQMTATFSTPSGKQELPGFMNSPIFSQLAGVTGDLSVTEQGKQVHITSGVTADQMPQSKTENQAPSLRQDTHGQYLNTKVMGPEKSLEGNVDNETLQQNNTSQQQTTVSTTTNTTQVPVTEQTTTNSFSNSLQESVSNGPVDSAKSPLPQPSQQSHLIREQEVLHQIVQRFSVQSRLQTSRMSLQLHPAELGELKIDLLLKGDSLKANIVAHTQQAQEIIEKNLPRLRAILQDQGISIEDLIVTFASDNVDDFSKQKEQLFQEQFTHFSQQKRETSSVSFEQTIEETLFDEEIDKSGVNLTV